MEEEIMDNEEIRKQLTTTYPPQNIQPLVEILETEEEPTPEKLEQAQQTLNTLYQTHKDDTNLIEAQVKINTLRNKYNITDPREIIHYDNGKGYVQ